MKILGLVTAKSNSKRVPYKNKIPLAKKPLYKWTTDFLESVKDEFEALAFSSDRPEVFPLEPDIWTPIVRPMTLCEDCSPHVLSVKHALSQLERDGDVTFDYVILFQPTTPLRNSDELYSMIHMLNEHKPMVGKTYYIDENISLSYLEGAKGWKDGYADASGDGVLIRSGSMYAYSRHYLMGSSIQEDYDTVYVSVPKYRGYNINNSEDFAIVEAFVKRYKWKQQRFDSKTTPKSKRKTSLK